MIIPAEAYRQYEETALWSSTNDDMEPLDDGRFTLHPDAQAMLREQVEEAWHSLFPDHLEDADPEDAYRLGQMAGHALRDPAQWAHDLWLTRNRHGVGFWDRGLGDVGDQLTTWAHELGPVDLYVGDDSYVHVA